MSGPAFTCPVCVDCGQPAAALDRRVRLWREPTTGRHLPLCPQHAWERAPFDFGWLPPVLCETCGVDVIRSASLASRRRVYCCTAHGELGHRLRQQAKREAETQRRCRERTCACGCGEPFKPRDPTQKYRHPSHRVRAWRGRRRYVVLHTIVRDGRKFEWRGEPDGSSAIVEVVGGRVVGERERFTATERDVKGQVEAIYADIEGRLNPARTVRDELEDAEIRLLADVVTTAPPDVAAAVADKYGLPVVAERFGPGGDPLAIAA